jgi:hypothetical protein
MELIGIATGGVGLFGNPSAERRVEAAGGHFAVVPLGQPNRCRDNIVKIEAQGMDGPVTPRIRRLRCRGTVEDHQKVALDVRELTRQGIFDSPVGSVFRLDIRG